MEKFVEVTKNDKGFDKENDWHTVCQKKHIPFITIKARSKLAVVQWDYITYPPGMDHELFARHESIKTQVSAIYARYDLKNTSFSVGPGVVSFWNFEIIEARKIAEELFDIIFEAARDAKEALQTEP